MNNKTKQDIHVCVDKDTLELIEEKARKMNASRSETINGMLRKLLWRIDEGLEPNIFATRCDKCMGVGA